MRPDPNDSQRIRFVLADSADNPFTYTVTVSEAGSIVGKLTVDRIEYDVTGDDMVTVRTGSVDRRWRWRRRNACQPCPCIQRGGQRHALRRRELRGWHGRGA